MPTTAPAHASMLTGLYPFEHGLRKNGQHLDEELLTMADLLEQSGFETAAFASVKFLQRAFAGDFGHFDAAWTEGLTYRVATETVDAALGWLAERSNDEQLFVWIHLFDPHESWSRTPAPPQDMEAMAFDDPGERSALIEFLGDHHDLPPNKLHEGRPKGLFERIRRYDAQIHYADRELERFYGALEDRGLTRDSLWIVTSDHGEGLGNHGVILHGRFLYEHQLRVPLILHAPGGRLPSRRVAHLARQIDLLPTVAEFIGQPLGEPGYPLRGRSLLSLMEEDGADFPPTYAFAQRRPKDEDRSSFEDGDVYSLRDERYKYIYQSEGPAAFYDLVEDPGERRDLIEAPSPDRERLRAVLAEQFAPRFHTPVRPESIPRELDAETLEELRALGYIE
jgi:arylsulfatase A-like enzyme